MLALPEDVKADLDRSDEYYYKEGFRLLQDGQLDSAKLEFLKAIHVSEPKSKWHTVAKARLMEIEQQDSL